VDLVRFGSIGFELDTAGWVDGWMDCLLAQNRGFPCRGFFFWSGALNQTAPARLFLGRLELLEALLLFLYSYDLLCSKTG
jgi:hypothetical protein